MFGLFRVIWRLSSEFEASTMGPNLFLFKFASIKDKERILDSGPCAFKNQMLAFCDFDGNLRPGEYRYDIAMFWIRIIGLPWNLMSFDIAKRMWNKIGNLVRIDTSQSRNGWANDLRLRIVTDITKPLRRFITIARGSGKDDLRGRLTYERLPLFCYACGLIGHIELECEVAEAKDSADGVKQYGEWLGAKEDGRNSGI